MAADTPENGETPPRNTGNGDTPDHDPDHGPAADEAPDDSPRDGDTRDQAPDEIIDAEVIAESDSDFESGSAESGGDDSRARAEARATPTDHGGGKARRSRLPWALLALLAAFTGGLFAAPHARQGLAMLGLAPPRPAPQGESAEAVDLAPIQERLTGLDQRVSRHGETLAAHDNLLSELEAKSETEPKQSSDTRQEDVARSLDASMVKALRQRLDQVSDDVARLAALQSEDNPAVSRMDQSIGVVKAEADRLKERIQTLENKLRAVENGALEATPRGRMMLALTRMQDRAMAGLSFVQPLRQFREGLDRLDPVDRRVLADQLADLEPLAEGLPTLTGLQRSFDDMAQAVIAARDKAEGSFLQGLFTVRRTDAAAEGVDGLLARAERRLAGQDLSGAIAELEKLDGAAAEPAAPWLDQARQLARARTLFDTLGERLAGAREGAAEGGTP
ncbi:COG4223 family protein [Yunchengibacter salinarum]|uniref:COG4223 family protein n=1 Tax=Yunchengibacter salinarum TaxID=3133399 RepID=UPI0035B5E440